jgi:hypothetical protein
MPWRMRANSSKRGGETMPWNPQHHSDLNRLIAQQFMLHEVQHHDLSAGQAADATTLVPVAHDLIDIYKCLHQGEFGVGHTIDNAEGFKARLYQEIMGGRTPAAVREPAVEAVSVDGRQLRVNLRALRGFFVNDVAGAVDDLARVCMESARITRGDNTRFFETLDRFKTLNQAGEIAVAGYVFAFPGEMVDHFFFEVRQLMRRIRQVPVFSHSQRYKRLNRPSYRVVERSVLETSPLGSLLEGRP